METFAISANQDQRHENYHENDRESDRDYVLHARDHGRGGILDRADVVALLLFV